MLQSLCLRHRRHRRRHRRQRHRRCSSRSSLESGELHEKRLKKNVLKIMQNDGYVVLAQNQGF